MTRTNREMVQIFFSLSGFFLFFPKTLHF
ncbi:hypothetical protein Patl1_30584 [Pistacia atlantica]|uniref:Uncharacterized protein n=1 Tax=Pistacia atlantica TaxID=434234 RepID=A0ACC1A8L0_9ROSI|nr:hypothetical protein Patl1_30584 [Pistacia atlantica]